MENSEEIPQTIKIKTVIWSSNLTSGNLYFGKDYVQRYRNKTIHRSIVCMEEIRNKLNVHQVGNDEIYFVIT